MFTDTKANTIHQPDTKTIHIHTSPEVSSTQLNYGYKQTRCYTSKDNHRDRLPSTTRLGLSQPLSPSLASRRTVSGGKALIINLGSEHGIHICASADTRPPLEPLSGTVTLAKEGIVV